MAESSRSEQTPALEHAWTEPLPIVPPPCTDHSAVKPLPTVLLSDVNVTLRKPVDELYTLDELTDDPESLPMRSVDSHAAVSQRSIDT
jgi:hypothetical protein